MLPYFSRPFGLGLLLASLGSTASNLATLWSCCVCLEVFCCLLGRRHFPRVETPWPTASLSSTPLNGQLWHTANHWILSKWAASTCSIWRVSFCACLSVALVRFSSRLHAGAGWAPTGTRPFDGTRARRSPHACDASHELSTPWLKRMRFSHRGMGDDAHAQHYACKRAWVQLRAEQLIDSSHVGKSG